MRRLAVTSHAVGRYRERFPSHARWSHGEVGARLRWLVGRGREVGNDNERRYVLADGVVLVVRSRTVVTVMPEGWTLLGNRGRAVPRSRKGRRVAAAA